MILEVVGASIEDARALARIIEKVLEAEHVEGFVVPGIVATDLLTRLGIERLPAVRSETGEVLWQGSVPGEDVVKSWIEREPT